MKVNVDGKVLAEAIDWVSKAVKSVDENRVMMSFFAKGEMTLSNFGNGTSYMKTIISDVSADFNDEKDDTEVVTVFADGKFLQKIASALLKKNEPNVEIYRKPTKNASLVIKTTVGSFTVPTFNMRSKPEPEITVLGEVDANEFFSTLRGLSRLCDSKDSPSTFLGAVDLSFGVAADDGEEEIPEDAAKDSVFIFATDRYSLGRLHIDFSPSGDLSDSLAETHFLLTGDFANAIAAPKKKGSDVVSLICEDNGNSKRFGYAFSDGSIALFSLLNVAHFGNIKTMRSNAYIDAEKETTVETNKLRDAIKILDSLQQFTESPRLEGTISPDGLVITDTTSGNHIEVAELEESEKFHHKFNFTPNVLLKSLSVINTSNVRLRWSYKKSQMLLEPVDESGESYQNVFIAATVTPVED